VTDPGQRQLLDEVVQTASRPRRRRKAPVSRSLAWFTTWASLRAPMQGVRTSAARARVVARPAKDCVIAILAKERILASASSQLASGRVALDRAMAPSADRVLEGGDFVFS
jgi:hypothetical protein